MPEKIKCPACGGKGKDWDNKAHTWIYCGRCLGAGYILASNPKGITPHDKD